MKRFMDYQPTDAELHQMFDGDLKMYLEAFEKDPGGDFEKRCIALLLFGGKKLPEMMRGLGQGVSEFKRGTREITEPINDIKREIIEAGEQTKDVVKE